MTPPETPTARADIQHSNHFVDRTKIVFEVPKMPGGGPPCIWDNGPTQKTGSCYTCVLCGSTTSCG